MKMSKNAIHRKSVHEKAFFPVVHCVDDAQVERAVTVAMDGGADGVFLVNQGGMDVRGVLRAASRLLRANVSISVGVNLLGLSPAEALGAIVQDPHLMSADLWADDAGVRCHDANATLAAERAFAEARASVDGWSGRYFGGVAFKYQEEVLFHDLRETAWTATRPVFSERWGEHPPVPAHNRRVRPWVDVVTTSGAATGKPPLLYKAELMRSAIGDHALAIASGITPENAAPFVHAVDAFLVATGIESSLGVFDPGRVEALAAILHDPSLRHYLP